jgi:RNA polymerase sigma-70 factor (ECF subfamily)
MSDTPAPAIKRFLAHQAEFMGYLLAMTRSLEAAEEIFQNAAVVMLEPQSEPIRDFRAWAKEVVRRQALLWLRARGTERRRIAMDPELLQGIELAFSEDDDDGASRRELDALRQCLQSAPPRARAMLAMRYQESASFDVIASAIGATAAAVQRALSRLRLSLRDCVRERLGLAP